MRVLMISLTMFIGLAFASDDYFQEEFILEDSHWSPRDLISNYSWATWDVRLVGTEDETMRIGIRWQHAWSFSIFPHGSLDLGFGRSGPSVYKCKENCDFPTLFFPSLSSLEILNRWEGTWYCFIRGSGGYHVAKAVGDKWVEIPHGEFPPQLAVYNNGLPLPLSKTEYMKRDASRRTFSRANSWWDHKALWYFLLHGTVLCTDEEMDRLFPDSEAFPFFLKYIKPYWKFGNPVLDMDFTPYEGMDPGQIPFPEELAK